MTLLKRTTQSQTEVTRYYDHDSDFTFFIEENFTRLDGEVKLTFAFHNHTIYCPSSDEAIKTAKHIINNKLLINDSEAQSLKVLLRELPYNV